MKVLLAAINAKYIHSNLGIYSLKTYGEKMLKEWGLAEQAEISLAEYTINHQMEQILQDIYKRKPDVIGFSCYIWNISYVKVILADIKKVLPDVKIWAGGPEVSYHGEAFLKEEPAVDLVMMGEGEITFAHFLKALLEGEDLKQVPGLMVRNADGTFTDTGFRQVMDMSQIPFPYAFMDMKELDNDTLEALRTTPGAYLGSCRFKLPDDLNDAIYPLLFQKFEEMNIGYFFYIGGNDSMDTVSKLSRYAAAHNIDVRIMGIPKTIDNDLILTDHTPGFGSAAKYVAASVCEIGLDASVYNTKSVTIIEIMGRHAGWLTAASVLARKFEQDNPVLIYLPEADFDQESFLASLEECFKTKNNLIVCVSEGIHDKDGTFICEYAASAGVDAFGHKMLTGCGKYLENLVRDRLGVKVRSVELNVNQRCSAFLQSETDALEAAQAGAFGVTSAISGETGKMVSFVRKSDKPYVMECGLDDVNLICNQEKTVPVEWITKDGTDIAQAFIDYALPLIQGSLKLPMKDGLAVYAYRKPEK